jgi:hypothetical protein
MSCFLLIFNFKIHIKIKASEARQKSFLNCREEPVCRSGIGLPIVHRRGVISLCTTELCTGGREINHCKRVLDGVMPLCGIACYARKTKKACAVRTHRTSRTTSIRLGCAKTASPAGASVR